MATRSGAGKRAGRTTPSNTGRRRVAAAQQRPTARGESATAAQRTSGRQPDNPWADWWNAISAMPRAATQVPSLGLSPERMLELQQDYMQRLTRLWTDFFEHPEKADEPISDSRFSDPAWQQNPLASFYARAYLLNAEFLNRMAEGVEAEKKLKKRIRFAVSQWVDAMSPSNFLALNPQAQKTLLDTKGESLKAGMQNLLKDIRKGKITQTDEGAFEIGRNVATSEGAVVYENELIQLIQYKALTEKLRSRPLLLVPPCINKFYIMDLQPENSFVRFAVEQGNSVFLVSWRNVHDDLGHLGWDEYVELGAIAAIHAVQEISGQKQINTLGFCVGGTILATALAVLAARGEDAAASLTLMTSLLDFEDAGVLDVFIDEQHVRMREQTLGKGGIMPGKDLGNTFSILRANDLVWKYVVSNYLEGKQPMAFDLLYWNGDSTNLPGPMYAWYLRNMYLENNLRVPNRLKCCGQPIDLGHIKAPAYVFAATEDHIVPWKAAYASARLLPGDKPGGVRFVLGASGHIAGSINPASKNKRSYMTAAAGQLPANSEAWLHGAREHAGSWWNDWNKWLMQYGGGDRPAPKSYGNAKYKVIEPAPGRYVKEKA
jgi:polyhydroxyalkanoate synthase